MSFFTQLQEIGLIEIERVKETYYVHPDQIIEVEKMVRIHQDLEVNIEGIDVVFNLIKKIETLQKELDDARNRLNRFEE
jgi:hypothetical protein